MGVSEACTGHGNGTVDSRWNNERFPRKGLRGKRHAGIAERSGLGETVYDQLTVGGQFC